MKAFQVILYVVWTLSAVAVIVLLDREFLNPSFYRLNQETDPMGESANAQRNCLGGILHYRAHHGGEFPLSLEDAALEGLLNRDDVQFLRSDNATSKISYIRPTASASAHTIILYDKAPVELPWGSQEGMIYLVVTTVDGTSYFYEGESLKDAEEAILAGNQPSMRLKIGAWWNSRPW